MQWNALEPHHVTMWAKGVNSHKQTLSNWITGETVFSLIVLIVSHIYHILCATYEMYHDSLSKCLKLFTDFFVEYKNVSLKKTV